MSKKNIAIIVKHLGEGGAQRSAAMLSLMLNKLGYKVSFIALHGQVDFTFKGDYYVLNGRNKKSKILNVWNQILDFRQLIKNNNFDFIIDFRGRTNTLKEFLMCFFVYRRPDKVIFTIRESKFDNYIPEPFFLFKRFYQKAYKILVVSKQIEKALFNKYPFKNIITINNGIDFKEIDELKPESIEEKEEFVVSIGRLVKLKQFEELIEVYSRSILIEKKIKLYILGEGKLEDKIKSIVSSRELDDFIRLLPFQKNPYKYMSKARLLVLQSEREGFPNVLVEALACGVPVVSFDCESGPKDIIQHKKNGLLVENQNFIALTSAINEMVMDNELYSVCKQNARESVVKFDMHSIALEWQKLLESH